MLLMPALAVSSTKLGTTTPLAAASDGAEPAKPVTARPKTRRRMALLRGAERVRVGGDAAPVFEATLDRGAKMNAAVEPRDRGLFGGRAETREGPGRQAVRAMRGILESEILAERLGQHFGRRGGLHAV